MGDFAYPQDQAIGVVPPGAMVEDLQAWARTMQDYLQGFMALSQNILARLMGLQAGMAPLAPALPHPNTETMEVTTSANLFLAEPHPGFRPQYVTLDEIPLEDPEYNNYRMLWDLACQGKLPSNFPGVTLSIYHLQHQYYLSKVTGYWCCGECFRLRYLGNKEDFIYIETHSVIHADNITEQWNPPCQCGAKVARVAEVQNCLLCQRITCLNYMTLHLPGQCLAVTQKVQKSLTDH